MIRPWKSPWFGAWVMTLVLAASVSAAPPTGAASNPPTGAGTTTTGSTTTGSSTGSGIGGLGFLAQLFGGSLFTAEQDAQFMTTAETFVQEIATVIPLTTEEESFFTFLVYEIVKLNAIQALISGGGMTTTPEGM